MKIENCNTRVVQSGATTEVFITCDDPLVNCVIYLPPDAKIKSGDSLEFVAAKPAPAAKEKV